MSSHMDNQIRGVAEGSATVNAQMLVLIITIVFVNLHVRPQVVLSVEFFLTHGALELLLRRIVSLSVTLEMLGSREGLATQLTRIHFDFLGAGVLILHVLRHRVEPHKLLVADVAVELLRFIFALRL